jgi:hypothetical protein
MYSSQIATEGSNHPGGRDLGSPARSNCSPCKARGRERVATRIVGWPPEPFCDACYGGEGTVFEMRGAEDLSSAARQRRFKERQRTRQGMNLRKDGSFTIGRELIRGLMQKHRTSGQAKIDNANRANLKNAREGARIEASLYGITVATSVKGDTLYVTRLR